MFVLTIRPRNTRVFSSPRFYTKNNILSHNEAKVVDEEESIDHLNRSTLLDKLKMFSYVNNKEFLTRQVKRPAPPSTYQSTSSKSLHISDPPSSNQKIMHSLLKLRKEMLPEN